jgi:hypothetical protein
MPHQSDFGTPCCLRQSGVGSALGFPFRGHICVHCRYGPVTRSLPKETSSMGFRTSGILDTPAILPSKLQGS